MDIELSQNGLHVVAHCGLTEEEAVCNVVGPIALSEEGKYLKLSG
ncbi:MAG: hypothetical protein C1O27_001587 [Chloroflexi bacterium]|jgi:hypothetical protein|nr:MAG: hypothetical protein C1O27_001587 [Chloroflexota bacterium]